MEADSCSNKDNNFLHSWASCETLVDPNEILCSICKQPTDSGTRLQLLLAENNNRAVFLVKSTVYFRCLDCGGISHMHCHLNSVHISPDLLVETITNPPTKCLACQNNV